MPQTTEKERSQATRETVTVAVASVMALFAGVVAMWVMTLSSMRDVYTLQVSNLAQSAAKQLSATPAASREKTLQALQAETQQIRYLQLVVPEGAATRVQVDTRSVQERVQAGLELVDDQALRSATEVAEREARDGALTRGTLRVSAEPVKGAAGYWLSAWVPVLNDQGRPVAALRVVANADTYMARVAEARKTALLGLLPSCLMLLVMALGIHRIRLDRIRLNRDLRQEQGRSRENEQSFRSLFELSPLGISLYDCSSGKFLQVNDALVTATGHNREHLLSLTHDDIAPEAWLDSAPWPAHELAQTHQYGPHEGEVRRSDGSVFSALMTGIGMTDAQGRRVIWSFMQDISQRKLLEQEGFTVAGEH
jgi:PAS domain S-box-containing protein